MVSTLAWNVTSSSNTHGLFWVSHCGLVLSHILLLWNPWFLSPSNISVYFISDIELCLLSCQLVKMPCLFNALGALDHSLCTFLAAEDSSCTMCVPVLYIIQHRLLPPRLLFRMGWTALHAAPYNSSS